MIELNHFTSILTKNIKDTIRNIEVIVLFIVYPIVAFVMTQSINAEKGLFISIFATMHFVFTPIVVSASLVAEEKGKNTLRVLRMSGITSIEFFLSTAVFVLLLDCITGTAFIFMSGDGVMNAGLFYSAGILGGIISILIGMCIGTFSKGTSAANGLAVPLGLVFAFLPMISSFNNAVERFSKYLYGQQVKYLISGQNWTGKTVVICLINLSLVMGIYLLLYKKAKIDE